MIQALRREAATSPFSDAEILAAGRALITSSEASTESLLELIRVAEQLAAIDPAQGLEGASVALREAIGGNFQSLIDRFELSTSAIQRFRAQGLSNLEAVTAALREMGVTSELVERLGQTFEGRRATIVSFFDELRQRLGEGLFQRISEAFGHMVNLIAEYGDRLRQVADTVGQTVGALFERLAAFASGPLLGVLERLAPGLGANIATEFGRASEAVEQTTRAMTQAGPVVQSLERQLAGLGSTPPSCRARRTASGTLTEDQLRPLEQQLRLLQESGDLQRVQNALAGNRGAVERLRLEREILALRGAAGGAVDPDAAGLTLRQRMIALALQERELRLEELGLEGERRPAIQSVQQAIAQVQEQQRRALEPLQQQARRLQAAGRLPEPAAPAPGAAPAASRPPPPRPARRGRRATTRRRWTLPANGGSSWRTSGSRAGLQWIERAGAPSGAPS